MAITLAACQTPSRAATQTSAPTPATISPTPAVPTDLSPITVSGTPVIIPSAIEFTPSPPAGASPPASEPQIIDFQVTPQSPLGFGDTVTVEWEVAAQKASLRYEYATAGGAPSLGGEIALSSLKGSRQVTLKAVDALPVYVNFTLKAAGGAPDPQTGQPYAISSQVAIPARCPYPWFFANPPRWCASTDGAGRDGVLQGFEKGRMAGAGGAVTVLFSDRNFWVTYPDVEPAVAAIPPSMAGMPVIDPALYGLWRDGQFYNRPIRDSIGQPTSAAVRYTAHHQCEVAPNSYVITRCFIDLPDGTVILLFSDAAIGQAAISWSVWRGE